MSSNKNTWESKCKWNIYNGIYFFTDKIFLLMCHFVSSMYLINFPVIKCMKCLKEKKITLKTQIMHYIFKYNVFRDWPCICEGLCLVYATGLVMNVWCLAVVFPPPLPRSSHCLFFFALSQHSLPVLPGWTSSSLIDELPCLG